MKTYENRHDPLDRLQARRLEGGGYECKTLAGDGIGMYPADVFKELYKEVEDASRGEGARTAEG